MIIIKIYDVTIVENSEFWWKNIIRVAVENNEHPRHKAIEFICKNGFMRDSNEQKIVNIKRVY